MQNNKSQKEVTLECKLLKLIDGIVRRLDEADDLPKRVMKELLENYGTVTARIKQCVTVKCYSTLPHDSYKRNAVKDAFEGIMKVFATPKSVCF